MGGVASAGRTFGIYGLESNVGLKPTSIRHGVPMRRVTVTEEHTEWYTFHQLTVIYGLEAALTLGQNMIQTGRAHIQVDGTLRFGVLKSGTFTREVTPVQPHVD